jgi:hypothetical protein
MMIQQDCSVLCVATSSAEYSIKINTRQKKGNGLEMALRMGLLSPTNSSLLGSLESYILLVDMSEASQRAVHIADHIDNKRITAFSSFRRTQLASFSTDVIAQLKAFEVKDGTECNHRLRQARLTLDAWCRTGWKR